jgi:hypothetical protein
MKVDRMSHSKASTADLCGQLYVFRYVEDHELPFGASGMRGKATHAAGEANFRAKLKTGTGLERDHVREIAASLLTREIRLKGVRHDGGYSDVPPERLHDVLLDETVALTGHYHDQIAPLVNPVAVELKVEIPPVSNPESGGWPFTWVGVIDLIDETEGGRIIRDTKTKRKAPSKTTADTESGSRESTQLTGYELLYRALHNGAPSAGQALDYIWQTPARKDIKNVTLLTQRDTHDLQVFIARVRQTHRALEAEIFLPAASDHWICSAKWCDFTDLCPYFNQGKKRPTT